MSNVDCPTVSQHGGCCFSCQCSCHHSRMAAMKCVCCKVGLNPISCSSSSHLSMCPSFYHAIQCFFHSTMYFWTLFYLHLPFSLFVYHCVLLDWTFTLTVVSALGFKTHVPCVSGLKLISWYWWSFDFLQNMRPVSCWIDYREIWSNLKYLLEDTSNWIWWSIDFSWSSGADYHFVLGLSTAISVKTYNMNW